MSRSYRDVLGDSWNDLAPGVKRGISPPVHAEGELTVFKANRGLLGVIAKLVQLPAAGNNVSGSLDLVETSKGIEWHRRFGSMDALSLQFFRGDRLYEIAGPFEFELRMQVCDSSVEISQIRQKLLGIPVPRFMSPIVAAKMTAVPDDLSWHLTVAIRHVWFGKVSAYEGVMRAAPSPGV